MKESEVFSMIEQWVDAWNAKDMGRVETMYADDVVLYQAPVRSALRGWSYIHDRGRTLWTGFPDAKMKINDLHVDRNVAFLEHNITGTHTGRFLEHEPTGKIIDIDSCIVFRVRNGKIVNHTTYMDTATILRALGLIQVTGTRPEAA